MQPPDSRKTMGGKRSQEVVMTWLAEMAKEKKNELTGGWHPCNNGEVHLSLFSKMHTANADWAPSQGVNRAGQREDGTVSSATLQAAYFLR